MKLKDIKYCPICSKDYYNFCSYNDNNHYFRLDFLKNNNNAFMSFRLDYILDRLSLYNILDGYKNLFICLYLNKIVIEDYNKELFFIMEIDEDWDFDSFEKCIKSWANNLELFG